MKTSAALVCGLLGVTVALAGCDAVGQGGGPSTIDQDVLTGDSRSTARPTTPDTEASTATGTDRDVSTATGLPNDSDASTATGFTDNDQTTATGGFGATDDASGTATPTQDPQSAPSQAPDDSNLPEPSLDPAEGASGSGNDLLPTTVRIGYHPDYDRVVFDLEGEGTPGYRVSYVDSAVEDGSGATIDVDGDAVLQVVLTGTRYPTENEVYEGGPGTYSLDASEEIEEVRMSGTFEGNTQAFIGIDDVDTPFRAFVLSDPARLVVDVAHSG
ncbi:MAG: hypothetical protein WA962_08370 [Ornithinimicrobium sp.]